MADQHHATRFGCVKPDEGAARGNGHGALLDGLAATCPKARPAGGAARGGGPGEWQGSSLRPGRLLLWRARIAPHSAASGRRAPTDRSAADKDGAGRAC
jgi:hypothetical protein